MVAELKCSMKAALTRTSVMFRLHEGNIKKEEIVAFLTALQTTVGTPSRTRYALPPCTRTISA